MNKTLMTSFLLLACSLALAVAQTQTRPQTDQQNMPSSSSSYQMDEHVSMTGCLRAGSEPNSWVLDNVIFNEMTEQRQSQSRTDSSRSQSSSSTPSGLARSETSYALVPDGQVDFKKHVGHKVEITGKMMEMTSRTSESSKTTTSSGQSSSVHSTSGQPQIKVSSIRHIAKSCQ